MHALLLFCLLLPAAPIGGDVDADEPVVRVYDLSTLFVASTEDSGGNQVFPLLGGEEEEWYESQRSIDHELPRSILRILLAGDFESEGVEVEDAGGERLIVRAAPAVHQRVQKALIELDAALAAVLELELCVLRLEGGSDLRAGLVPQAQAEAWIDAAAGAGRLERMALRVGRGSAGELHLGRQTDFLGDFDVEVAEGSMTFDPVMFPLNLGTRLTVRAAAGRGGQFVALAMRRASALGELRQRRVERAAGLLAGDSWLGFTRRLNHESQPALGRSLALNAFLPDGQALVVLLEHAGAGLREALIVRVTGGGLTSPNRLTGGPGGRDMVLLDASHWSPPVATGGVRELFQDRQQSMPHPNSHSWTTRFGTASSAQDDGGETLERALELTGESPEESEGWWPLRAVALGSDPARRLQQLESLAAPGANVQVSLVLRRGASVLAEVELPLLLGRSSEVVLCSEDLYVFDADVEIAKYSALEDPIQREVLEGLFASLRPSRSPAGAVLLELRGIGVTPSGALRTVELADSGSGEVEVQTHDYLFADELLRFESGRGSRTVRIGDAAGGLALDVTLGDG